MPVNVKPVLPVSLGGHGLLGPEVARECICTQLSIPWFHGFIRARFCSSAWQETS